MMQNMETAILGGGCFWCIEPLFQDLKGVIRVESGYTGGTIENPSYQAVCTGTTGHAEVIKIEFDPAQIGFSELLEVFFTFHDPTTLNRQGNDIGTQYRSVIFYQNEQQKVEATAFIQGPAKLMWNDPIVTEIAPAAPYYPAESYHQNYYKNNPNQSYCAFVITPKVLKFRKAYQQKLKSNA
ncbi:MAG: peptide-methionine (S)-S-oxide reductase MsrA [Bacteroidetes bacterium]|nr:peptide-methionine (S)-S-oxide reductase MsrA [Bacteroidota bacterium]